MIVSFVLAAVAMGIGVLDPLPRRPHGRRDPRGRRRSLWPLARGDRRRRAAAAAVQRRRGGWSPGASRSASSSTCATACTRHLQSLELGFFDSQQTGQLMSRSTVDLQAVRFFLGYGLIFILQSALTILIAAGVMLAVNPELAARRARAGAVRRRRRLPLRRACNRPASQEVQQRIAELTAEAEENVSGVRVVKAFAQEAAPARALPDRRSSACSTSRWSRPGCARSTTRSSASCPSSASPALLLVGGRQAINGHDHRRRVRRLLRLRADADLADAHARHRARDGAARGRLGRARVRDPRPRAAADGARRRAAAAGGRRARCASTASTSPTTAGEPVLRDVDLDVEPGQTVALVGATGSGKTTLVDADPAPLRPDRGPGADRRRRRRAASTSSRCAARSRSSPTTRSCSRATLRENIAYARPDADDERGPRGRAARRAWTSSSTRCPTATRRSSASAG